MNNQGKSTNEQTENVPEATPAPMTPEEFEAIKARAAQYGISANATPLNQQDCKSLIALVEWLSIENERLLLKRTEEEYERSLRDIALSIRNGAMDAQLKSVFVVPFAAAFARHFELSGAPNYLAHEMHFELKEAGQLPMEVIIKPIMGKTPARMVGEWRARANKAEAQLAFERRWGRSRGYNWQESDQEAGEQMAELLAQHRHVELSWQQAASLWRSFFAVEFIEWESGDEILRVYDSWLGEMQK